VAGRLGLPVCAFGAPDPYFGTMTASMTWITPFDWSTSAMVIVPMFRDSE
jgi:hypothetical protein